MLIYAALSTRKTHDKQMRINQDKLLDTYTL